MDTIAGTGRKNHGTAREKLLFLKKETMRHLLRKSEVLELCVFGIIFLVVFGVMWQSGFLQFAESKREEFMGVLASLKKNGVNDAIPLSIFRDYYDHIGPKIMASVLNENQFCHSQAHNLGRVIYEHTQDLAASTLICKNSCRQGCIHGVLMEMFETEQSNLNKSNDDHKSVADLSSPLRQKIGRMCETSEITRYSGLGNCYHAIGHGLTILASYDMPDALKLCDVFKGYGIGALYYCATGVYMERDIVFGEDDIKKSDQGLYPCDTDAYPIACYRYKLRRIFSLPKEYKKAQEVCLSLDGLQRKGCFHGLGFGAYVMVYQNPADLNLLCSAGDAEDKQMCIEGVLGAINNVSKKRSTDTCSLYTASSKELCFKASKVRSFGMERDFNRYAP